MTNKILNLIIPLAIIAGCTNNKAKCPEPSPELVLNYIKEQLDQDKLKSIFNQDRLENIDTIVFFKGNFSGNDKNEYLAMSFSKDSYIPCASFSHLPPPYETANYLLTILSCKDGNWEITWSGQENEIKKENITYLDEDSIPELIFSNEYDCDGGILYGYYYIASLRNNTLNLLYEKETFNKTDVLQNPELRVMLGDTLSLELNVRFEDIDNNGSKEIIEKTKARIYNGGIASDEMIFMSSVKTKTDTLYLKNDKYKSLTGGALSGGEGFKGDIMKKMDITKLMMGFQDYLNNCGFTQAFYMVGEGDSHFYWYDESYYEKAVKDGRIDQNTDLLKYATKKILESSFITDSYKEKVKTTSENKLDFTIYQENATIGAILTQSEIGMDFRGPLLMKNYYNNKESLNEYMISEELFQNGFNPDPDSILASYDISPYEIYRHFIELKSTDSASYYMDYNLLKIYGNQHIRFVMDFVFSEDKGWQIDNMYFDDFSGNLLKESS